MRYTKAEFTLSGFLIGLTIFSMVIGAFALVYGDLGSSYNIRIDNSANQTYNQLKHIENTTLEIGNTLLEDSTQTNTFVLAGRTVVAVPKLVSNELGMVTSLLGGENGIIRTLGIDPLFITAGLTIVTLLVGFAMISLWRAWRI